MSLDALGEWLNLGTISPNATTWAPYDLIQPKPSQVLRVSFSGLIDKKFFSYVRIRGVYFTALKAYKTSSIKVYPSLDTKIIELPLAEEILALKNWQLSVEIKKILGYRQYTGKILDVVNYQTQVESWSANEGQYLSPSQVQAVSGLVPRGSGQFTNFPLSEQVPNGLDDFIG